jgi:hypothetical protein
MTEHLHPDGHDINGECHACADEADGLAAVMGAIVEFGATYAASSVRQLHVETAEVERQVRLYRQRGIVEALDELPDDIFALNSIQVIYRQAKAALAALEAK